MAQYAFHVNIANCIACRACEVACAQEYDLPAGLYRRRVLVNESVDAGGKPTRRFVSMACNHCETPGCLNACPVGRYVKDATTGIVDFKPSKADDPVNGVDCIGCRRCEAACPYGAPQFDVELQKMDKCTGCLHRIKSTVLPQEKRIPACVLTCTSRALHWDVLTDIDGGKFGESVKQLGTAPDIADPKYTNPSVRFSTKRW